MKKVDELSTKNSCDLLTAITHTEILVARCIFLIESKSVSD